MSRFNTILTVIFLLSITQFSNAGPRHFPGLPADHYHALKKHSYDAQSGQLRLQSAQGDWQLPVAQQTQHRNGDISLNHALDNSRLSLTVGDQGMFGYFSNADGHFLVTTDVDGSWAVKLPSGHFEVNSCGLNHETAHHPMLKHHKHNHFNTPASTTQNTAAASAGEIALLDVLVIYDQALADRYPGEMLNTRVNQYVNESNQVLANTQVELRVRLVGVEQVDYNFNNSNFDTRNAIAETLAGRTVPGFEGLLQMRQDTGADLVIMIRPHDIETRGSCGIAYFPVVDDNNNYDASFGVNMVSDGMSSWSICTDQVFIHEIGHNMGAGHQYGRGGGFFRPEGAAIAVVGRFNTVMGSFGSGFPDRFFEIQSFSNTAIQCGGQTCGVVGGAEPASNADVIRETTPFVTAYQPAVSNAPMPNVTANNPDSDGDGVPDWTDVFPFISGETVDSDGDGVGDNSDAFPNNAAETIDTDGDGIGNNSDPDDDNDGVNDFNDDFPLDANESADNDQDGIGNEADAFDDDASEQKDFDNDGTGDNADTDDDNDGFIDLSDNPMDVLVISTGNNRLLRFDAVDGTSKGIEVVPSDGLFTFQSNLAYREQDQTLFYTSQSSVKRLNLMRRETQGIWIPAYDTVNFSSLELGTGFPTGLAFLDNGNNLAVGVLNTPFVLSFAGQQKPSVNNFVWDLGTNSGVIDMISYQDSVIVLDQIRRIYRIFPDTSVTQVGPTINSWMADPYAMTADGDRLFISDQVRNIVGVININTGDFEGELLDLDDFDYSGATGLAVIGDVLLVAARDNDAILRFNKNSGAFLGELVSGTGLSEPQHMVLVPQLNDRYHNNPDRQIRPNAGLWFDPDSGGRGLDIQVFNNRLTAVWYTYDENGLPIWYYSSDVLDGFEYSADFLKFTRASDGTTSFTTVGSLQLRFISERTAEYSWEINGFSGNEDLMWFEFNRDAATKDYTGLWGPEDEQGAGMTLTTQGNQTIALPFVYDDQGEPRWVMSRAATGGSPLSFQLDAIFSDTLCPQCTGDPAVTLVPAGTIELQLEGDEVWSSQITLPEPLSGTWTLDQTPIKLFSEIQERPR